MNVSSISLQTQTSYSTVNATSETTETEAAKGKKGMPPGQMAKQAIAEAGLENAPPNLHGKVTSALARGLDITSLLAIQEEPVEDPAVVGEPADGTTGTDTGAAADVGAADLQDGETDGTETAGSSPAPAPVETVADDVEAPVVGEDLVSEEETVAGEISDPAGTSAEFLEAAQLLSSYSSQVEYSEQSYTIFDTEAFQA